MTASPSLNLQATETLGAWLRQENISLAFSTYQTNRLILLGTQAEGRLALQERLLDKPMGMFATENGFYLSCRYQIWQFENHLQAGETYEGADRLYVPSRSFTTGGVNVHDVALDQTGQLFFVNTDFSCLAALEAGYSFKPLWRPPFIRKLASEDSCHLNGLALAGGVPTYMSVCSLTPEPAGWRNHRHGGGAVFHLPSNEIVARGLSMPHSPRYYRDKLWVLNSGTGELGYIDQEKLVPVAFCPGFVRGLAFWKHWAILGLSKLRSAHFTGLPLEERLTRMGQVPQCGLMVVNLETGAIEQSLILGGTVEELYDVLVLPGVERPKALGFQDEDIERLVNFPGAPGLITTKPALKRDAKGPAAPIPGLPTQERLREERPFSAQDLKYQRVYHLNPESLLPYDDMTYPSLAERWRRQGQRGELVGVSVSLWGELLGFVIGEKLPFDYAQGAALGDVQGKAIGGAQGNAFSAVQLVEIISFKVDARYRRRGLGKELMATLERQLAKEGIAQLTLTYDAHPQICQTLEPLLAQLGWAPPQDLNAQQKRGFKPLGAGLTPSLEALFAQGTAAAERGDAAQAVAYYQQALTLDPQSAPIHCNLGVLWQQQGRFSEALQAYLRALELKPDLIQGYQNLTALDLQAPLGALSPEERIFLLTTLMAGSLEFGFYDQAQQAFQALETLLLAPATELGAASAQKLHQYLLFNLPYLRDDPAANSRLSFLVGRAYRRLCLPSAPAPEANPGDSLRIGVMSRHFRRHSVAWCSRAILQAWSELTPHLFLYQTGPAPADDLTQQLQTLAAQFTDLSRQAPGEMLAKLRADRLDVLIDLDSLMNFNHAGILSQSPAPVTVSWLGCEPPFISENNYYLCDRQTHPEGSQPYYLEQLLYLPHCGVALEEFPVQSADPQRRRQELGIAPETVVYLSPAPGKKLTPELVKAQVAILQGVPNSVLLHKGYGHPAARALYPEACASAGVDPQRCRFLGRQRWEEEHRLFYLIADVGLDTYPYNGGTHNLEFLWFNVPLVTRRGEQAPSRFGYGFLNSLGIGEGVAQSWEEYIDWGVRYGADPALRQAVRERLQQSKATAPLWRPREWAEEAYRLFEELLKKKSRPEGVTRP